MPDPEWRLGGIRIYAQDQTNTSEAIMPRLQPQGGGSIYQLFGKSSPIMRLDSFVVTSGDMLSLRAMEGTSQELIGPRGNQGDWIVKSVEARREMSANHVFFDRPFVPHWAPLFRTTIELWEDD